MVRGFKFKQANIIKRFPKAHHGGVCFGLSLFFLNSVVLNIDFLNLVLDEDGKPSKDSVKTVAFVHNWQGHKDLGTQYLSVASFLTKKEDMTFIRKTFAKALRNYYTSVANMLFTAPAQYFLLLTRYENGDGHAMAAVRDDNTGAVIFFDPNGGTVIASTPRQLCKFFKNYQAFAYGEKTAQVRAYELNQRALDRHIARRARGRNT